jgi:phage repressor protein C with HTH and peptisase S24 domain
MKKKSTFFERVLQIIDFYDIKNVNIFAKNYLNYASSEKINRLKKENTNPSYEIIVDITNKFEQINPEWLLTGKGEMLRVVESKPPHAVAVKSQIGIPLVSVAAVGGFGSAEFSIKESDVKEYYVVPKFKDRRIDFMIEVAGSSMLPKYSSGDVVACTILKESRFIQWGKVHVVGTREQGILIKRLYPCDNDDEKCIKCQSDNNKYPPFEITHDEITGIALVVGVIRLE